MFFTQLSLKVNRSLLQCPEVPYDSEFCAFVSITVILCNLGVGQCPNGYAQYGSVYKNFFLI